MSSRSKPLGIVVGVDGSPPSKVAVDWAAREASLRQLPVTVVHAAGATAAQWPVPNPRIRGILDGASAVVNQSATAYGPPRLNTEVLFTDPVVALAELSHDAEMVVVGAHRRNALRRRFHRSVSSGVLREAHCPVAVIHDEDPLMPYPAQAPVLAGVDGSLTSKRATRLARQEASCRGVDLVVCEKSASRLVEQSEAAQLVVVGNHDHVAAAVAKRARMPVLVTR